MLNAPTTWLPVEASCCSSPSGTGTTSGQPSTGAPRAAREAAVAAIEADALGYTETVGIRPLREAIAAYHRDLGVDDVSADDVVVTTGSSGAFTLLFLAAFDAFLAEVDGAGTAAPGR